MFPIIKPCSFLTTGSMLSFKSMKIHVFFNCLAIDLVLKKHVNPRWLTKSATNIWCKQLEALPSLESCVTFPDLEPNVLNFSVGWPDGSVLKEILVWEHYLRFSIIIHILSYLLLTLSIITCRIVLKLNLNPIVVLTALLPSGHGGREIRKDCVAWWLLRTML